MSVGVGGRGVIVGVGGTGVGVAVAGSGVGLSVGIDVNVDMGVVALGSRVDTDVTLGTPVVGRGEDDCEAGVDAGVC